MKKEMPKLTKKQKLEVAREYLGDDKTCLDAIMAEQRLQSYEMRLGRIRMVLIGMSLSWLLLTCVMVAILS